MKVIHDSKISGASAVVIQTLALFFVAYFWFSEGLYGCWKAAGESNLAALSMRPSPPEQKNNFHFALISAATHTLVLIGGVLLCKVSSQFAHSSSLPSLVKWTLIIAAVIGFFTLSQVFFQSCFERRAGLVYEFAASYFYDLPSSSHPFSLMSSYSYSVWLAIGILFRQFSSDISIIPAVSTRWLSRILLCFVAVWGVSQYVLFPLWEHNIKPMAISNNTFLEAITFLPTITHTVSLAFGMMMAHAYFAPSASPASIPLPHMPAASMYTIFRNTLFTLLSSLALLYLAVPVFRGYAPILLFMSSVFQEWAASVLQFNLLQLLTHINITTVAFYTVLAVIGFAMEYLLRKTTSLYLASLAPLSASFAKVSGNVIVALCLVTGVLHSQPKLFYSSFAILSILLCGGTLLGAAVTHVLFNRAGVKIQAYKTKPPKYVLEVAETTRAMFVFAYLASYPLTQSRMGLPTAIKWTLAEAQPFAPDNLPLYLLSLVLVTLLVDLYMYTKHVILHMPLFFALHRAHHTFHDPSPFAGFAVHPIEALITFGPVLLLCNADAPVWGHAYAIWVAFFVLLNFYLHCGYEIPLVENVLSKLFINTSAFHNMHHERTVTNFGELLYLWDYICDTGYHKHGYNKKTTLQIPNIHKKNAFLHVQSEGTKAE